MPLPITRPDSCDKLFVFTHAQKAFLGVVHTEFIAYIYNNSIVASYFKGMFGKKLIIDNYRSIDKFVKNGEKWPYLQNHQ